MSTKCLTQRMDMLKPSIYTGLNPESSRRILAQVIMLKSLYGVTLWDHKIKLFLHGPIKLFLGAHYNLLSESLHLLANMPPIRLLYTGERLQLTRELVKTNNLCRLCKSVQTMMSPELILTLQQKTENQSSRSLISRKD